MGRADFLYTGFISKLAYPPTTCQDALLRKVADFVSSDEDDILVVNGYAGTGKTTAVSAVISHLKEYKTKCVLLAPTGRAAKVFSSYAGCPASTIHKRIYRQKTITDADSFSLNVNLSKHTLFIVDEASMISNEGLSSSTFGTGRLLDDLIQYVYSGEGCRLMLMGDTAQLPPVGDEESPALMPSVLASYGLQVYEHTLTQVMRQLSESGILYNATMIRCKLMELNGAEIPDFVSSYSNASVGSSPASVIDYRVFSDVCRLPGDELVESLTTAYSHWGADDCMIICRSNKRANIYNQGIRNMILYREEELSTGDRIMVVKNNYYWIERLVREQHQAQPLSFIANGDIAVVRRVRRTRELYGFRFADVLLSFPDYDDYELETTVLLDTLHSESPSLTREESNRLFEAVMEDYADISQKKERYKQLREDPHFNALQIKYAYAVTCHKAQGGQWSAIYLDQGYLPPETSATDYYRWLYTAFTRATEQVYLVNWPTTEEAK